MLSVPATQPDRVRKAWTSGADQVVIDLEDSVAPELKERAREGLPALFAALDRSPDEPVLTVRVNQIGSRWFVDDLMAVASIAALSAVMVPKIGSGCDVYVVDMVLRSAEASRGSPDPLPVYAILESAPGLSNAGEIAAASPRLAGLVLGYADMTVSLGRRAREDGFAAAWLPVQSTVLEAARSAGVVAVDGPWLGVADDEDFRHAVRAGADLGFDATWVIHPRQVGTANRAHMPSAADLDRARRVRDAVAAARAEGHGAAQLDGRMVDEALRKWADAVLTRSPPTAPAARSDESVRPQALTSRLAPRCPPSELEVSDDRA